MLPDLKFSEWRREGNEIFFQTSNEINRVVCQKVPAYIVAELPSLRTKIIIGFPASDLVRIYVKAAKVVNEVYYGDRIWFVGEFGDPYWRKKLPKVIRYRYGVRILPWMYNGYLKSRIDTSQTWIINYVIQNSASGFSGIILKLRDEYENNKRQEEWFKILSFDAGNEVNFWKTVPRELIEFVPIIEEDNRRTVIRWEPKDGLGQFKEKKIFPTISKIYQP